MTRHRRGGGLGLAKSGPKEGGVARLYDAVLPLAIAPPPSPSNLGSARPGDDSLPPARDDLGRAGGGPIKGVPQGRTPKRAFWLHKFVKRSGPCWNRAAPITHHFDFGVVHSVIGVGSNGRHCCGERHDDSCAHGEASSFQNG